MRLSFKNTSRFDLMGLHAALMASSIFGITGVSADADNVYVELPTRDKVTEEEFSAIESLVAANSSFKSWEDARKKRVSLLKEADWRIERADDNGLDSSPMRAYRQALRDITKQSDPDNVVWPVKPWESV